MGKTPAVIFVQWHLTSPTPYDPPLTYGGWNQSRALGVRIERLLREREQCNRKPSVSEESKSSPASADEGPSPKAGLLAPGSPRRKQQIIIHCSPFLRCVQTAIAISSGVSQGRGIRSDSPSSTSASRSVAEDGSLHDSSTTPHPQLDSEDSRGEHTKPDTTANRKVKRGCLLRLDAFLGEWLTPDYFDQIPPPPGSVMMVASAKADLLRPAEIIELTSPADVVSASGFFPGGWNRSSTSPVERSVGSSGATQNPPGRLRSGTLDSGSGGIHSGKRPMLSKLTTSTANTDSGYIPPTPTYAVKSSDPIPRGYVSHARDACVEVDYQWDSMREPQNWGSGGEYGEEWSSMHERFRNGLERMIAWYKSRQSVEVQDCKVSDKGEDAADDTETVLILVSHGAGCNALIGALTNRPALLDIGISSLTMAVRKAEPTSHPGGGLLHQDGPSALVDVSDEYDRQSHFQPGILPGIPNPRSFSSTEIWFDFEFF
ncbi:conserved hypothetical protein [Uncinocarpus reesii 1704]|uniref:Phosphoglycerate mutase n=1 Tax=Uncinocarpus reesii (strain UAMH 1704) TaxID=336963 RepID=C4JNH5_UNCRE|nr:uncharacterized protein UREG_02973 [Uncinocarpus reesii 1704]EEP78128.1 conserved hypothetical protein [Uncinocarpus reesii 1704]